ncbi:MAG: 6-bladed beta-propeller [Candidatus Aminicenantales bacterium]
MRKKFFVFSVFIQIILLATVSYSYGKDNSSQHFKAVRVIKATEMKISKDKSEYSYFSLPADILFAGNEIFVLDSKESEIKVFSARGNFRYSIGRRGRGPGEFSYPSDIDFFEGRIYVADKMNRRIQVVDREGNYLFGFKVDFFPQNILVLNADRILVSHLPLTSFKRQKILHCFNRGGELLWESLDSFCSGDSVYDVFANQVVVERNRKESFYVVKRFNERNIYFFRNNGELEKRIEVGKEYSLKKIAVPTKPDRRKEIRGFCWWGVMDEGKFFFLEMEFSREEKDLIPGKRLIIVNLEGKIKGVVELPERLHLFCVKGSSIYGIDTQSSLKIYSLNSEKKGD